MSWAVVDRATGKAVGELFDKRNADRVNLDRFEVVPITQRERSMGRRSYSLELRGQQIEIDLHVLAPEHDVGIMGYGFEDESITDADGKVLDWELTDEEIDKINEIVSDDVLHEEPDYL